MIGRSARARQVFFLSKKPARAGRLAGRWASCTTKLTTATACCPLLRFQQILKDRCMSTAWLWHCIAIMHWLQQQTAGLSIEAGGPAGAHLSTHHACMRASFHMYYNACMLSVLAVVWNVVVWGRPGPGIDHHIHTKEFVREIQSSYRRQNNY